MKSETIPATVQMGQMASQEGTVRSANRATSATSAAVRFSQYDAKENSEVESEKMPENVEQTSVLSYLETVYKTHLEKFDINQDINQESDTEHSAHLKISDDTAPEKALSEESEKRKTILDTVKEPHNQNEKQSDEQVGNESKLQNAASELLNLIQYATQTNENRLACEINGVEPNYVKQ